MLKKRLYGGQGVFWRSSNGRDAKRIGKELLHQNMEFVLHGLHSANVTLEL
jgi:hypothetical protein